MLAIDMFLFAVGSTKDDLYNYIKSKAVAKEAINTDTVEKLEENEDKVEGNNHPIQSPRLLRRSRRRRNSGTGKGPRVAHPSRARTPNHPATRSSRVDRGLRGPRVDRRVMRRVRTTKG